MVALIFLLLFTPLQSISVRESQINLMFLSNTFISSGNSGSRGVSDALTEGANERESSRSQTRLRMIALIVISIFLLVLAIILIPVLVTMNSNPSTSSHKSKPNLTRFINGANMKELLLLTPDQAVDQLVGAKELGINEIRVFLPLPAQGYETNLDRILQTATRLELSIWIVLLDNWGETFDLFLDLSPTIPPRTWRKPVIENADNTTEEDKEQEKARHSKLWTDASARSQYKSLVTNLLTRNDSISGAQYAAHPAIKGYDLVNEPRCEVRGCDDMLQGWLEEMAAFVRSLMNNNQTLVIGSEGFFGPSTPHLLQFNPGSWAANTGQDFVRNNNIKEIDVATLHFWPDNWNVNLSFAVTWISSHLWSSELDKPLFVQEFGLRTDNHSARDVSIQPIYDIIIRERQRGRNIVGSFVWELGPEEGTTLYEIKPSHNSTREIIRLGSSILLTL